MKSCLCRSLNRLWLLGCLAVSAPSVACPPLEAISAKFSTQVCALPCTQPQHNDWTLWRSENRVETRSSSGQVGEIWRRDDQGRISFVYIEPAHQRGIEYNTIDLRLIGKVNSWEQLASIVAPAELEKLARVGGEIEFLGLMAQRYQGQLDGHTVEVVWLPKLKLAAQVIHTHPDRQITIELKSFLTEPEANMATSDADLVRYQLVDFADVGDMETNPAMAWLKRSAAPGHNHHHH